MTSRISKDDCETLQINCAFFISKNGLGTIHYEWIPRPQSTCVAYHTKAGGTKSLKCTVCTCFAGGKLSERIKHNSPVELMEHNVNYTVCGSSIATN